MGSAPLGDQVVQQRADWHEPSVFSAQSGNQFAEAGVYLPPIHVAVSEVGVENTGAAFGLQPVLIGLAQGRAGTRAIGSLGGAIPVAHERPGGIVIGKQRRLPQRVDTGKDEVSDILNPLPTEVAPTVGMPFNVTEKLIPAGAAGQQVVEPPAPAGEAALAPARGFRAGIEVGKVSCR